MRHSVHLAKVTVVVRETDTRLLGVSTQLLAGCHWPGVRARGGKPRVYAAPRSHPVSATGLSQALPSSSQETLEEGGSEGWARPFSFLHEELTLGPAGLAALFPWKPRTPQRRCVARQPPPNNPEALRLTWARRAKGQV